MNKLQKIVAEAKRIRRQRPAMQWKTALKEAGRKFRGKKVGATLLVERGESAKTKPKRVVVVKRKRSAPGKGRFVSGVVRPAGYSSNTVPGMISGVKKALTAQIGDLEAKKFAATRKVDKNKIAKRIAELKRQYRKML